MADKCASLESITSLVKCLAAMSATHIDNADDEERARMADQQLIMAAKQMAAEGRVKELHEAFIACRDDLKSLTNARSAKIVRAIVDACLSAKNEGNEYKENICKEAIAWTQQTHRVYLERTIKGRLIKLYNEIGRFPEAAKSAAELVKALRKVEDRELLMETLLEESKAAFALNNHSRAKTALTNARTVAHGLYVSTTMQAELDLHTGILYAADEKEFKTAFSYFFEAFEGFVQLGDAPKAVESLKLMCLGKILLNEADQIKVMLDAKVCQKYIDSRQISAMRAMGSAFKNRRYDEFKQCLVEYRDELQSDVLIRGHINHLKDRMVDKEISRVIEPYSAIEIDQICKKTGMDCDVVEKRVSNLLRDNSLHGTLDQKVNCFYVKPPPSTDVCYKKAGELLASVEILLEACTRKAKAVYA